MKRLVAAFVAVVMAITAQAGIARAYETSTAFAADSVAAEHAFDVTVKSADFRKGLVRITCDIKGRPNTSHRIDAVALMPSGKISHPASDIDGVEFKHYFQWEDNGVITIEIDFPVTYHYLRRFDLVFDTVYGKYTFQVKHP